MKSKDLEKSEIIDWLQQKMCVEGNVLFVETINGKYKQLIYVPEKSMFSMVEWIHPHKIHYMYQSFAGSGEEYLCFPLVISVVDDKGENYNVSYASFESAFIRFSVLYDLYYNDQVLNINKIEFSEINPVRHSYGDTYNRDIYQIGFINKDILSADGLGYYKLSSFAAKCKYDSLHESNMAYIMPGNKNGMSQTKTNNCYFISNDFNMTYLHNFVYKQQSLSRLIELSKENPMFYLCVNFWEFSFKTSERYYNKKHTVYVAQMYSVNEKTKNNFIFYGGPFKTLRENFSIKKPVVDQ